MGIFKTLKKIKQLLGLTPVTIKLKKLNGEVIIPKYAHNGDVCVDLTALSMEYDSEEDMYIYHTGIAIESDEHYGAFLLPRSSNRRTEAYLCNHVGVVDSYIYRGEIMLCFKNRDSLQSRALAAKTTKFFELIEGSKKIKTAVAESNKEWNKVMENPLQFAPYNVGDRVAQMVILHYPYVKFKEADELSTTERGDGGFGSTGN